MRLLINFYHAIDINKEILLKYATEKINHNNQCTIYNDTIANYQNTNDITFLKIIQNKKIDLEDTEFSQYLYPFYKKYFCINNELYGKQRKITEEFKNIYTVKNDIDFTICIYNNKCYGI